jgi:phospholipid/cholesterol/gamma-HCH transport system substrate-binding protein
MTSRLYKVIAAVVVLGLVAAGAVWYLRPRPVLTVTARFAHTEGLFAGNEVNILGVPVGTVESVVPRGGAVTVTMTLPADTELPANVQAWVVVPSVISDHVVELSPYHGGAKLTDGARIPLDRTHAPVRWDQLMISLDSVLAAFGPDGANSEGALGRALDATAQTLEGTGDELNTAVRTISHASGVLAANTGDVPALVDSANQLVDLLQQNSAVLDELVTSVSSATSAFTDGQTDLAGTIGQLSTVLTQISRLVSTHGPALVGDLEQLASLTTTLVGHQQALLETLDTLPLTAQNLDRAITPEGRLRVRLNISTNLSQLDATRALCEQLPLPLCTGAGIVNPIPFPPGEPDPTGLTALLNGGG